MCKRKSWMSKVTHVHAHTHGFPTSVLDAFSSQFCLRDLSGPEGLDASPPPTLIA